MPKREKQEVEASETLEVTRSFARKLNMAAHGGKQYETADIFCSVTATCANNEIKAKSKELDILCQQMVQETIDAFDEETEEVETAEVKPEKKKKTVNVGVKVEQEEFEGMQEYVNDLTLAKTAEDLKAAVIKIKAGTFTEEQKKYLTAYYLKRKDAISK